MKRQVAVIGAGGHARVIASIIRRTGQSIYGFFDDSYHGKELIQGYPLRGKFDDIYFHKHFVSSVYLAIGSNKLRYKLFNDLLASGFNLPPLKHPDTLIEDDVFLDSGTVVCIGAILATEVSIGKGVIINTGSSVDHESKIGNFVHIAPKVAIAGRVTIGDLTFIGIGASIADKVRIGTGAIINSGSIVLRDVADYAKVYGVIH